MSNSQQNLDDNLIYTETLLQQVGNDLDRIDNALPSQRANYAQEIEKTLNEIDSKITRMNSDAKKLNPSTREYYDDELSNLRSQYSKFVSELRKKQTLAANDPYFRQGSQIEKNNEKAQSITENLDEAIRLGNDSITTANATMTTLLEDRKHIDHINENLDIIHAEAITGTERAKRMVRRACFNNCLIWSIVVFLVALLGFSLYWKLRKTQK